MARYTLRAQIIGLLAGDAVILILLPFMHLKYNPIAIGSFLVGWTLILLGVCWWAYRIRKLGAIKKAATRAD